MIFMDLEKIILDSLKEIAKNNGYVTNIEIRSYIFEKHKLVVNPRSVRKILVRLNYEGIAIPSKISEVEDEVKKKLEDKLKKIFGRRWRRNIFERMIIWKIDIDKLEKWLEHGNKY